MELVNITYAGQGIESQNLSPLDRQLVTSNFINSQFGQENDYLELYIYDENGQLLDFDYDAFDYYPYLTANPQNNTYSTLTLDPEKDLKNRGFNRGNLNIQYHFHKRLFSSAFGRFYWIKEISTSRTEIKLASQVLSNSDIKNGFNAYQGYIGNKNYYPVFYLNFGNNETVIADNVAYTEDEDGGYLLIKLYAPLSPDYDLKTQLWIVDKVAESVSFNVNIQVQAEITQDQNSLRGPNFNVVVNSKNGQTTPYYNYNNLLVSPVSSSYQKLLSYYQDKSVEINVDYTNFSNFIHFSSATERVSNFVYKLGLIESFNAQLVDQQAVNGGASTAAIVSSSVGYIESAINNITQNFDTYEYFLYFKSESFAWPKSTSTQPFKLYSITSSQASNFLGSTSIVPTATTQSLLFSASYYDATNKDLLHNSIPQYLLDDPNNQSYVTFMDMIGQHFDNIWIYYKDLSNRYNATNNPDTGISLDVVSDALKGFGVQLYTNSNVSDNLYYTLFGINPDGSLLPPTGSEKITTIGGKYVTSSLATLPAGTIQDELYKRLYHNLPYLLKTKGTQRGVKALISTFGIPEEILTVREFGGSPVNSIDGVFDLDTTAYKLTISTGSNGNVSGSLELSSSLLSPFTTLQYYDKDNRINSINIEVGFSPADTINTNITASKGYFDINQLIGSPGDQYSSSYSTLTSASNAYFSTYTQPSSIWEYIRLIKFYNNSLFKMIKDYVPARANLATGIIVKSHMLERNKYARHEPSMSINNNFSQSIDILYVDGSEGGMLSGSTYWSSFVNTPIGPASYTSSQGVERFNGELSGSHIIATTGASFDQSENSNLPISSSTDIITVSRGALYQNVTSSVRSLYLWDLDYSTDQLKPVNLGIITQSINNSEVDNYADYNNPMSPYAYVQDYNYFLERSILPRYKGSKTVSATYTTYTNGDDSYGKTAAIDKIKYQYAYLLDIYSSSMFFPKRSNAQIKYIIDNNQNVLDLTKANSNIFTVQNVFKSGETTDISLFQYDELNPYSQLLANNPTLQIFEGGFRYLPILHNLSGSSVMTQSFNLTTPDTRTIITQAGGGGVDPNDPVLNSNNWSLSYSWIETPIDEFSSYYTQAVVATYTLGNVPFSVVVNINTYMQSNLSCDINSIRTLEIIVSSGTNGSVNIGTYTGTRTDQGSGTGYAPGISSCSPIDSVSGVAQFGGGGGGGGSSTSTIYVTTVTGSQPCVYYISESSKIVLDSTIAYYYNTNGITYNSTSDTSFTNSTLQPVVTPFNLNVGDRVSFYDEASKLAWDERFEYTVKNISITGSGITGSRLLVETDRPINLALLSTGSFSDSLTGAVWRGCRYIFYKHIPDETNVILRYNPTDSTIVETGLLFPQYIDPLIQANAGNTVKALKQQNLLDSNNTALIFQ
jgi:hypothetical protein